MLKCGIVNWIVLVTHLIIWTHDAGTKSYTIVCLHNETKLVYDSFEEKQTIETDKYVEEY